MSGPYPATVQGHWTWGQGRAYLHHNHLKKSTLQPCSTTFRAGDDPSRRVSRGRTASSFAQKRCSGCSGARSRFGLSRGNSDGQIYTLLNRRHGARTAGHQEPAQGQQIVAHGGTARRGTRTPVSRACEAPPHSNVRSHRANEAYLPALRDGGGAYGMSREGDCTENVVVDSFFATIPVKAAQP